LAVAVVEGEGVPGLGQGGGQAQLVAFQVHASRVSSRSRYIQPAEPVYQVQPPRPV